MLITCDEKDLTLFEFGGDFSKVLYLFEALRLNDNRLYDTSGNLKSCNLAGVSDFWPMCLLHKQFLYGLKGGCHNVFAESC